MGEDTRLRLVRARSALQQVEGKQGVRSYAHRSLSEGPVSAGVYEVGDGAAQLLSAMKSVCAQDSWMALVGVANFGWEAAGRAGIDLERVIEVQCDSGQAPAVLSTLLEGFAVVIVGDLQLSLPQQRTLSARARMLDRFILTVRSWPLSSSRFFPMDRRGVSIDETRVALNW